MNGRRLIRVTQCVTFLFLLSSAGAGQQPPSSPALPDARARFPVPADLRVIRDIEYARYGDRRLLLDLYRPASDGPARLPVIVVVRGGGWRSGDKQGFAFIAGQLAAAGFATTCIEYRTTDEARFPAAVHDVKAAIRWVRANAARFGLEPNHIGAIGGSAGGQLVALAGVSANEPGLEGDGGNPGVSSRLSAIVAMAPVTDFRLFAFQPGGSSGATFLGPNLTPNDQRVVAASPVTHVSRQAPPLLMIHSTTDSVVPYQQSLEMKGRYDALVLPVELIRLEGAPHDFWNYSRWFPEVRDQAVAFFRRTLR